MEEEGEGQIPHVGCMSVLTAVADVFTADSPVGGTEWQQGEGYG